MSPIQTHPNLYQILRASLKTKNLPKQPKVFERRLFFREISFYYRLPKNAESIWMDVIKSFQEYEKIVIPFDKIKALNTFIGKVEAILKLNNNFELKKIYLKIIRKNYLKHSDETFMKLIGLLYGMLNMYNLFDINFLLFGDYYKNDLYKAYRNNISELLEENFKVRNAIDWLPSLETLQLIELMAKRRLTLRTLNI